MKWPTIIVISSALQTAYKERWRRTTAESRQRAHIQCQWTCCHPDLHTQHVLATNADLHRGWMPWVLIKTAMPSQEVNNSTPHQPPPSPYHTHTHTEKPKLSFADGWVCRCRQTTKRDSDFMGQEKLAQWVVCRCLCGRWDRKII